ncbi:MAG: hydroxyacid dehydrogenase [Fidelibacterota bacterium]|nr:MAG: hydroxyacid dehydrogenase [Candidatus Neomarinimicrobiota bacterium]
MNKRWKVLIYEPVHSEGTHLLEEKCDVVYPTSLDEEHLIGLLADVDGIFIRANGAVSRRLIEAAPHLKVIGRHGVGVENIDLTAARENGVIVVYAPTANAHSVAEHFMGLALMLASKMRVADRALRAGNWKARLELIGRELHSKTLGIVGFGRIGQQTARICRRGFNMSVLYHDVLDFPETENELGARRVPLEQLFSEADFISLNLALLPQTRGLINADLLKLMKPTAFLINMARGPVWNEADVVRALKENWIAGVGSDVFEVEPASPDNPLFEMDNFVGTPHMAAHTEEALIRMSLVARDILRVIEGQEPEFPIPEEVYAQYRNA